MLSRSAGKFVSVIHHYHESLRAFDSLPWSDIPIIHVKHWTSCGRSVSSTWNTAVREWFIKRTASISHPLKYLRTYRKTVYVQYLFMWDVIERTRSGVVHVLFEVLQDWTHCFTALSFYSLGSDCARCYTCVYFIVYVSIFVWSK